MYLAIKEPQDIRKISSEKVCKLVDDFIENQDIKQSSKKLYRRTLKQYFNWVTTKNYLLIRNNQTTN
ncbi:hypothetical protein J2Q11_12025 [Tenacibaculum finnmarkense genomovar finnmarkense]|uniref:Core-binding (CB) domain-containing protein n=1 Tax=Tenacibaculum finnmarkense genomovar finnmarkense TaxID=1458503 RepID=A0AAP1RHK1_9FLAO|nr:hypothetical protein [Tenacibaculum finnmarkense]MBE7653812.1 hypothetical protein [Tenacibaculum finnmarkense genomovar finnmarkense]MBE7661060.1 hypothetical protein [Tenacibaculum finnmarkense genomovar finnmarkense]MBE7696116.1 hypothetical protein [Tenacibaculum finnmarkense genomovar finnmarkense]MCD8418364.1 hypothetical protein [Tenacibaculum finnmarkense genomovar finnmarkense]MCD8428350.1 hypothetical protein [Tenacibaculum finnmarkense genomovar finnmarkense]